MNKIRYLGIFLISSSSLTIEVFFTRFFSVSQGYHFAFMVVSIALLGYGASGSFLMLFPSILKKDTEKLLYTLSLIFSLAIIFSYFISNRLPFDLIKISWDTNQIFYIFIYYILLSIPFLFAGAIISITITQFPGEVNRIYLSDLSGASIGSLLPLLIFPVFGGIGPLIISSILALIASILFTGPNLNRKNILSIIIIGVIISIYVIKPSLLEIRISPFKSLQVALRYPNSKLINTKWNSFSRIDIIDSPLVRFAPGLSLKYFKSLPPQIGITIDGNRMIAITELKEDIANLDFIPYLISSIPFYLGKRDKVLILEPAGGLDILTALYFKSPSITGIEINPLIYNIMSEDFRRFSGGIYGRKGVKIEIGNVRGLLKRGYRRFDIIQIPILSSLPGSPGGGFGLIEGYQFTEEAIIEYFTHLNKGGILSITRYLLPPPREEIRLVVVIYSALKRMGIANPERYIAVIRSWGAITILVKKGIITTEDITIIKKFCKERLFDTVYYHGIKENEVNIYNKFNEPMYYNLISQIFNEGKRKELLKNYLFDITSVKDDKPFFFHFLKWSKIGEVYKSVGNKWQIFIEGGYLLPIIFIQVFIVSFLFIILPLFVKQKGVRLSYKQIFRFLSYFFFIGIGFMFVEIALIQKLILFLDHPVYAVSLVLFCILLFSGIGSFISRYYLPKSSLFRIIPILVFIIMALIIIIPFIINIFLGSNMIIKGAITIMLLAPSSVLMGMPFPLGIRILEAKGREIIPWAWCVNGVASVLGSILAVMIALSLGFNSVLFLAGISYLFTKWGLTKL